MVAAVALVALLGVACGGDGDGSDDDGASGGGGGDTATLTAVEFAWDPDALTVEAGAPIEVVNEDEAEHNFTIEGAGVDEDVAGGERVTVELTGLAPGSYDFVCEYHPETMKGTLEVE